MDLVYEICLINEVLALKVFDEAVSTCEILLTFSQRWPEISQLVGHA